MYTRFLECTDEALALAAELIKDGRLVGMPTETVYGLAADALNETAVEDIYIAKGRPGDNPLIVHIADMKMLRPLISGEPCEDAKKLAGAFWPGPLTMIFPKSALVPERTTGHLDTVAVRMPSHPVARKLIELSGKPIAAPSGNLSGRPSPTAAEHMLEDMNGRIPLILDGGPCGVGVESTVVDMTGDVPRILRPGGISREQIEGITGRCLVDEAVMRPLKAGEKPKSPGMKYRHYAPRGAVTIYHGSAENVSERIRSAFDEAESEGKKPLILALSAHIPSYGNRRTISLGANAEEMARSIFSALREADELGADIILSEAVENDGIGLAVMNRLGRAAAFHVEEV